MPAWGSGRGASRDDWEGERCDTAAAAGEAASSSGCGRWATRQTLVLAIGSLGVIYGDIATSPLCVLLLCLLLLLIHWLCHPALLWRLRLQGPSHHHHCRALRHLIRLCADTRSPRR